MTSTAVVAPQSPPQSPPRKPGGLAQRRAFGVAARTLAIGLMLYSISYVALRSQHTLLRTGWVHHTCETCVAHEHGWRDVTVAPHRERWRDRPTAAWGLNAVFAVPAGLEAWFRMRFEDCCSTGDWAPCAGRERTWWK